GGGEVRSAALHEIPRQRAIARGIRADQQHGGHAAARLVPTDEADDQLLNARHARRRQDRVLLPARQQGRVVEALGTEWHDPQIALAVVEHGGDAVFRPEVNAELYRDQDHGEYDADQRDKETEPVVEQIAIGEL